MIRETALRCGHSPEYVREILDVFFDTVVDGMRTDQLVMLRPDLGHFEMRQMKSAARGKEPAARSRRTPVFKKSGQLKALLRGDAGPAADV